MDTALWILAGALAVAFGAGGLTLLATSQARYRALGASQHWVDDFDPGQLKLIGAIKLLGALGLVLPALLGVLPVLTPLAACGLMLFMAGAGTTRFRRKEWTYLLGDLVFVSLFALLAWGRFDLAPF
ncbi:DoxX family protein [Nocardioides dubius]|uniref:DoxX family protein n=1 Tax=Nocardioides dubius TaxID=317019 RepID=A0ABN1TRN1_9ACTN